MFQFLLWYFKTDHLENKKIRFNSRCQKLASVVTSTQATGTTHFYLTECCMLLHKNTLKVTNLYGTTVKTIKSLKIIFVKQSGL